MKSLLIALLLCSLYIPPGGNYVIFTSHYKHLYPQDQEFTWSSSGGTWVAGPTYMITTSPGHPIGHTLMILGGATIECGEIPNPNRIFVDGFESGDMSSWQ